jgi:hypothetical protein
MYDPLQRPPLQRPQKPAPLLGEPIDASDHNKIREQARSFDNDRFLLAAEKHADFLQDEKTRALLYSKDYGQTFMRTVFLLNGGAILSLLTFIGSMFGKSDLNILVAISLSKGVMPAFYVFATGLAFAALVAAVGFFNWTWVAEAYPTVGQIHDFIHNKPIDDIPKITQRAIRGSYFVGVAFALASLCCFLWGVYLVVRAFSVLDIN